MRSIDKNKDQICLKENLYEGQTYQITPYNFSFALSKSKIGWICFEIQSVFETFQDSSSYLFLNHFDLKNIFS